MNTGKKYNKILSHGVVAKVAKYYGTSHQSAWQRIFVRFDPKALEIAAKFESEIRMNKKIALQNLLKAKSINIEQELIELAKCPKLS
jgi:hypothetical protein